MYEEWLCFTIANSQNFRNGIEMKKALVVFSGGQDSTTALFWAIQLFDEVRAITFDYGQRHSLEIEAARKIAMDAMQKKLIASWEVIKVPDCLHSISPLTSDSPLEKYENAEQMAEVIGDRVELTFVPMRNFLFLTIAMNRAVEIGSNFIVTGICQEDNANYPDTTEAFRRKFEDAANEALGTNEYGNQYQILAPLMNYSKAQTVKLAYNTPGAWEALSYSHTSYDGKYPPTDMNHANVLRAQGFKEAGLPDPLVIRAWMENLMELPETSNYDSHRLGENNAHS
jgi:7-cyano-7-deazaguanine synthase